MLIRSRREFMKAAVTSVGALGAFAKFGEMNALASTSAPYQALVCIFLSGGNDGHNMVIPINAFCQSTQTQQTYNLYAGARQSLAQPLAGLQTIHDGGDTYGLHPLMPEIANLYNAGNAAILANVGMLVQPTTRQIFQANNPALLPAQLFSHSDQTNQWQTAIPNGSSPTGWGGRVEDNLQQQFNANASFTPITSTSGCGLFCTGAQTFAATVPVGGASLLQGATTANRLNAVQQLLTFDNGLKLVQSANTTFSRGIGFSTTLTNALKSVKLTSPFPGSLIGQQLLTVAQIISIQQSLGVKRQVFFCQLGGFDTHGAQLATQDPLLQQLSQAVGAFYTALSNEIGQDKNVVTFTASEFGRTLQPNGNAGTDHAWGSHHFVIGTGSANGGPLYGNRIYGTFPSLVLNGQDDANSRGTLVPTTSVDQYAATLAQWFGVDSGSVNGIFNYVHNFQTNNLGFLNLS
ncbi:MAG TPA: DUF1501 domain-containing protein [Bryobacteraceae bacterium]|nr:DUF1501 domain-containing protein [Bryobacteraceae bacterium]